VSLDQAVVCPTGDLLPQELGLLQAASFRRGLCGA
jgi:hypothetical protein